MNILVKATELNFILPSLVGMFIMLIIMLLRKQGGESLAVRQKLTKD